MPLQRFLKVRGKPGHPVANPYAIGNSPPRFAGKQKDPALDGEHKVLDRYRDVEEILPSHQYLLDAVKEGELELVAKCDAYDYEDAAKKMATAQHAAPNRSEHSALTAPVAKKKSDS